MKKTAQERFDDGYTPEPNSGCWLWNGAVNSSGYGALSMDGAPVGAHRASWILNYGPIKGRLHVLHKCDVPSCVNPNHLFLGTAADNAADMVAKGRSCRKDSVTPHQKIITRWNSLQKMATAVTKARPEKPISKSVVQGWWGSGLIPSRHHSAVLFAGQLLDPKVEPADFFEEPVDAPA